MSSDDRRSRIESRRSTGYYQDGKLPTDSLNFQSSDLSLSSETRENTNQNRESRLSSTRIENFGREKTEAVSKQNDEQIQTSESSGKY